MHTNFDTDSVMVKVPILRGDLHAKGQVCPFISMPISYRKQVPVSYAFFE